MATVTEFLADVRRRAMQPQATASGSAAADILKYAQIELETRLFPLILRMREEYFLTRKKTPIVSGQRNYLIPSSAIGTRLRNLFWERTDGSLVKLSWVSNDDLEDYGPPNAGLPSGFALRAETVQLWPKPEGANGYLVFEYYARPPEMTADAVTSYTISSYDSANTRWNLSASTIASGTYNIMRVQNGFTWGVAAIAGSLATSPSNIFTPTNSYDVPEDPGLLAGFKIYTGSIDFVPVPQEMYGVLVEFTAAALLRHLGFQEQGLAAEQAAQRMGSDLLQTYEPRVEGAGKKLTKGILSQMARPWWLWR